MMHVTRVMGTQNFFRELVPLLYFSSANTSHDIKYNTSYFSNCHCRMDFRFLDYYSLHTCIMKIQAQCHANLSILCRVVRGLLGEFLVDRFRAP